MINLNKKGYRERIDDFTFQFICSKDTFCHAKEKNSVWKYILYKNWKSDMSSQSIASILSYLDLSESIGFFNWSKTVY